jgi:hypothetical protein
MSHIVATTSLRPRRIQASRRSILRSHEVGKDGDQQHSRRTNHDAQIRTQDQQVAHRTSKAPPQQERNRRQHQIQLHRPPPDPRLNPMSDVFNTPELLEQILLNLSSGFHPQGGPASLPRFQTVDRQLSLFQQAKGLCHPDRL